MHVIGHHDPRVDLDVVVVGGQLQQSLRDDVSGRSPPYLSVADRPEQRMPRRETDSDEERATAPVVEASKPDGASPHVLPILAREE